MDKGGAKSERGYPGPTWGFLLATSSLGWIRENTQQFLLAVWRRCR